MGMEMCPSCRAICNLIITTSTRIVSGKNQEKKRIRARSFHCEGCFQFVRSEDDAGEGTGLCGKESLGA